MPDIAKLLKDEMARLARKHARAECDALRTSVAAHRRDIASLKREIELLKRRPHASSAPVSPRASPSAEHAGAPNRYSAKSLASQRRRLNLSAEDLGLLIGVSGQTIYLWESGRSRPRPRHMPSIFALRTLGRRAALDVLARRREAGHA